MDKKVIGVFHSEEEAIRKIDELEAQGVDASDIYAVAQEENDISMVRGQTNVDVRSAGGNWFDRFVGFITGEEPVREAMRNMGLSGPDMDRYYQEIGDGGILLYVDKEYGERYSINPRYTDTEPHDVESVDSELHTKADVVPHTEYSDPQEGTGEDEARMTLHEEKLEVDKEEVQSGEVKVRKNVVEEEQTIDVPVSREEVYIKRRPVGEQSATDEASASLEEDQESIRIPLKEERLDVKKKPVVKEEIIVGKKEVEDTKTVKETVRREKADIHRSGDGMMNEINQGGMVGRLESDENNQMNEKRNEGFQNHNGLNSEAHAMKDDDIGMNMTGDEMDEQNEMEREMEKRRGFLQSRDNNPYTDNDRSRRF